MRTLMTTMMESLTMRTLMTTTMEFLTNWKAIEEMKGAVLQRAVHRIRSSFQCATTRTAGSGWTGGPLRGTPGCLVSWDTGLDSGDPDVARSGPG